MISPQNAQVACQSLCFTQFFLFPSYSFNLLKSRGFLRRFDFLVCKIVERHFPGVRHSWIASSNGLLCRIQCDAQLPVVEIAFVPGGFQTSLKGSVQVVFGWTLIEAVCGLWFSIPHGWAFVRTENLCHCGHDIFNTAKVLVTISIESWYYLLNGEMRHLENLGFRRQPISIFTENGQKPIAAVVSLWPHVGNGPESPCPLLKLYLATSFKVSEAVLPLGWSAYVFSLSKQTGWCIDLVASFIFWQSLWPAVVSFWFSEFSVLLSARNSDRSNCPASFQAQECCVPGNNMCFCHLIVTSVNFWFQKVWTEGSTWLKHKLGKAFISWQMAERGTRGRREPAAAI